MGLVRNVAVAGVIVFGALTLWALLRLRSAFNLARLQKARPSATVFLAQRGKQFENAISVLAPDKSQTLPPFLAVVADEGGIEIWGTGGYQGLIFRRSWASVVSIEVDQIQAEVRRFRGITVRVHQSEALVDVPLILTGSGFLGIYPPSKGATTALVDRILAEKERAPLGRE